MADHRRPYRMDRRAVAVAATRELILEAAIEAYREHGIRGTSMHEVARRAGVAAGTVLNHFPTPDDLAVAALERIAGSLDIPDERILVGARSRSARIRRLVAALFGLYDRSAGWFELLRGEWDQVPALRDGEASFWEGIGGLYATAVGPLLEDPTFGPAVRGLTSPATHGALREAGLSLDEASALVGDVLVRLARSRARAQATPGREADR